MSALQRLAGADAPARQRNGVQPRRCPVAAVFQRGTPGESKVEGFWAPQPCPGLNARNAKMGEKSYGDFSKIFDFTKYLLE